MAFVSDQQRKWFFANLGDGMKGTATDAVMRLDRASVTPRMLREITDYYVAAHDMKGADAGQMQAGTEARIRHFRETGLPKNFSVERFYGELQSEKRAIDKANAGASRAAEAPISFGSLSAEDERDLVRKHRGAFE